MTSSGRVSVRSEAEQTFLRELHSGKFQGRPLSSLTDAAGLSEALPMSHFSSPVGRKVSAVAGAHSLNGCTKVTIGLEEMVSVPS